MPIQEDPIPTKHNKENSDPLRKSHPNTLFRFPFIDKFGTVKDALCYNFPEPEFLELAPAMQTKVATDMYNSFCIGGSKMKLIEVIDGLKVHSANQYFMYRFAFHFLKYRCYI